MAVSEISMITQTIPMPGKKPDPTANENLCTLCGSVEPWNCEHCMGAMAVPPYSRLQGRKFIGSGEDAHVWSNVHD